MRVLVDSHFQRLLINESSCSYCGSSVAGLPQLWCRVCFFVCRYKGASVDRVREALRWAVRGAKQVLQLAIGTVLACVTAARGVTELDGMVLEKSR